MYFNWANLQFCMHDGDFDSTVQIAN